MCDHLIELDREREAFFARLEAQRDRAAVTVELRLELARCDTGQLEGAVCVGDRGCGAERDLRTRDATPITIAYDAGDRGAARELERDLCEIAFGAHRDGASGFDVTSELR